MALEEAPTGPQMKLLRTLASRTGQTFAWPADRRAASREIRRLQGAQRSPRHELSEDRRAVAVAARGGAAAVRADELEGYGSSARWRGAKA